MNISFDYKSLVFIYKMQYIKSFDRKPSFLFCMQVTEGYATSCQVTLNVNVVRKISIYRVLRFLLVQVIKHAIWISIFNSSEQAYNECKLLII